MKSKGIQEKGRENENKEEEKIGKKKRIAIKDKEYGGEWVNLIFIRHRFLQGHYFTVSPSTTFLPHEKPASSRTSHERCGA